jgi:DNA-binding GntR family transcriptional regulator
VASFLREEIYHGHLRPGQRLIELDLCKQLDVSRAPLREAMLALQRDGLLEMKPHRGASVVNFSDADIREIYSLRRILDPFAASQAAARKADVTSMRQALDRAREAMDRGDLSLAALAHADFHRELGASSGLDRTADFIGALITQMLASHAYGSTQHPEELATVERDHQGIVDAIAAGNGELAAQLARDHFRPVDPMIESYAQLRGRPAGSR